MKRCTFLALSLLGFVQTLDLTIDDEDRNILKFIGLNAEPTSEEFQHSLRSGNVPLILNPTPDVEPPKFAAAIFRNGTLIGAGAIISRYFVITVCSLLRPKGNTKIDLSTFTKIQYPLFKTPNDDMELETPAISKIVTHPGCVNYYKIDPVTNVGLIQTVEPMKESASLKYPKLPTFHIPEESAKFMISNFRVNNPTATDMKQAIWYVFTKLSPKTVCKDLFAADKQKYSPEGNMCMSYFHFGDGDQCRGDVGAPLSIRYGDQDILIGLNMHKHRCGYPREVAAFVCVKTNKEWIENTMNQMKRY